MNEQKDAFKKTLNTYMDELGSYQRQLNKLSEERDAVREEFNELPMTFKPTALKQEMDLG